MPKKKEYFRKLGKAGARKRWTDYRFDLINELRKYSTKGEMDFYVNFSNSAIQEAIFIKRQQKNERKT